MMPKIIELVKRTLRDTIQRYLTIRFDVHLELVPFSMKFGWNFVDFVKYHPRKSKKDILKVGRIRNRFKLIIRCNPLCSILCNFSKDFNDYLRFLPFFIQIQCGTKILIKLTLH